MIVSPSGTCARAERRRRRRRPSRCAAPRAPRRTTCAPASANAASSSSVSPPSGPTTTTTEPRRGTSSAAAARRRLVQHDGDVGRPDAAPRRRRWSRARRPRGTRRAAPAWPPRGRWSASGPATSSARSPAPHRDGAAAAHGTIGRDADLGQHLDRELAAIALGQRLHDRERRRRRAAARRRPRPSTTSRRLPVVAHGAGHAWCRARRSGRPAHRHAAGVRRPRGGPRRPRPRPGHRVVRRPATRPSGPGGHGRLSAGRGAVERVADAAEHRARGAVVAEPCRRASPRPGSRPARAAAPPGAGRAGSGCRPRRSRRGRRGRRAAPGRHGRGRCARCPDCVPGLRSSSKRGLEHRCRRRAPRRPRAWAASSVVPSAAAVIGTVTAQCRSCRRG